MRILQLNVWTGRIKGALLDFFEKNQFDVICLQEAVWSDKKEILEMFCVSVDQIKEASGLKYEFRSANWEMGFATPDGVIKQGNVILSRDKIISQSTEIVHGEYKKVKSINDLHDHAYALQIAALESGINIVNHHGYWLPTPVGDNKTVETMHKVGDIVRKLQGPVVMCGDLNITYASPAMRELDFLQDLTEQYQIKNTLMGLKYDGEVACDHILVNDEVMVEDFKVLDNLVSDHRALVAKIKTNDKV